MVAAIDHRGPDSHGVRVLPSDAGRTATLGAVRLRVIDVSPTGDQPMPDERGELWLVFNGELYNFRELRHELQSYGSQFRSGTDTECVLHLYRHFDGDVERVLSRLRGMFAFGLWDTRRGRLTLARDRLGIKPLYWAATQDGLAFCSEQRALMHAGLAAGELSDTALASYLAKGVLPGQNRLSGLERLAPGHLLTWEGGAPAVKAWWRPVITHRADLRHLDQSTRDVEEVVCDAVTRHLVADRTVGIFLSAGTDSTAVATIAARSGAQRSLTVTFPDEPDFDEGETARKTAASLGFQHAEVPTTGADVADLLPTFIKSIDSPSGDALNTWLVCRAATQANLVVALSGLGGDELFAGYNTFNLVPRVRRLAALSRMAPGPMRGLLEAGVTRVTPGGPIVRALGAGPGSAGAYDAMRGVFSPREISKLGLPRPALSCLQVDSGGVDAVTLLELTNYLPDQLLADTDSVSMAHSLEVRVPLLDDDVVAVALALPPEVRAQGKQLLADSAGLGPKHAKQPFTLPLADWMRGALRPAVEVALLDDDLPLSSALPHKFREQTWDDFLAGKSHWSRPWSLAVLRMWAADNGLNW